MGAAGELTVVGARHVVTRLCERPIVVLDAGQGPWLMFVDPGAEQSTSERPVLDQFRLDNRVAIITGGASSLGQSLARGLAEAGATIVIASRNLESCQRFATELKERGGSAVGLRLDLTDEQSIDALAHEVVERYGRADILVNNAISRFPGDVHDFSAANWEAAMRVDATGFFLITQRVLHEMAQAGSGSIINIASPLGERSPVPELYPAGLDSLRPSFFFVKAGVINFTRYLAVAYAAHGVRVNCLSPGYNINPPGYSSPGGIAIDPSRFAERVPMRRLGHLDEYKGAAVFLASDAASYMTGQNLVVDGGYSIW